MDILNFAMIGLGLAMDAAAVSMCKGLAVGKVKLNHCLIAGAYFGIFQGVMPAIGYALGRTFSTLIDTYAYWVSFALLVLVGANMLRESFGEEDECACQTCSFAPRVMLPLAVATSIDAMVTGVSFLDKPLPELLVAVALIAAITFVISAFAVWLGSKVGDKYGTSAERAGGIILILIGVKILLEGLGVW